MFSLIWLKKILVLLFISFLLMLIDFLKKFWRFVKQNLLKIVIARSPVYFIVLMLILYYHFYVISCTNNLCSVDVSVSVNSNINGPSINIFDKNFNFTFYNSSRVSSEVRKYQKINLLAPKSNSNSDYMNILPFFFIFLLSFNFLRKRKNDPRLKIILTSIAFLKCIIYRFSKPPNRLKSCFTCQFFTHDTIDITIEVNTSYFQSELSFFAITKFRFKNDNSFYPLLLLLLGDISLNPGPFSNPQLFKQEEWQAFSNRGLHLIHLNFNSLLPNIDELRYIAKRTNSAVIVISESKLDSTVLDPEIHIENYEIPRFDRKRHGGDVACYIRSDISYKLNSFLPNEIENITFDILMPHTTPITIGIIYGPPNVSKFLDIFEENLPKVNSSYREIYFLGDFNINLFEFGKYVLDESSSNNKNLDSFTKKYHEYCTLFGLKQLIKCPTRATCNSSSILDHVLASFPDRVSISGVIDVGISDHQLIYCTRKTARIKSYCHKQITFRSLKNYSPEVYEEVLRKLSFPSYEIFNDIDKAYENFFQKVMAVIDSRAPSENKRIKGTSQDWSDAQIIEKTNERDKLFKKFKKSRVHVDKDNYKEARNEVQKLIRAKKKAYLESKLTESIGKPKGLWKSLKSLGLKFERSISNINCLENDKSANFDVKYIAKDYSAYFSNLAENLVSKLPNPSNKYGVLSVAQYYSHLGLTKKFDLLPTEKHYVLKILRDIDTSKAADISKRDICNLSISLNKFPRAFKLAKVKPIFKKGRKTNVSNYRPISLLPILSKVIEKVVHEQITKFLNDNNIFSISRASEVTIQQAYFYHFSMTEF